MERAKSAMERVPLLDGDKTPTERSQITSQPNSPFPVDGTFSQSTSSGIIDKFFNAVHRFFYSICRFAGSFVLRVLSTFLLLTGVLTAVLLQLVAYYYTGVLNRHVLIACLLYAPALAAAGVLREETLFNGTGRSGAAPVITKWVTMAYLVLTIVFIASISQPLILRLWNSISPRDLGLSLGATLCFYYNLLVSEVLFSTALNVRRAVRADEELIRRRREDPPWMTAYEAIEASKSSEDRIGDDNNEDNIQQV